jgi:hypothetical protein
MNHIADITAPVIVREDSKIRLVLTKPVSLFSSIIKYTAYIIVSTRLTINDMRKNSNVITNTEVLIKPPYNSMTISSGIMARSIMGTKITAPSPMPNIVPKPPILAILGAKAETGDGGVRPKTDCNITFTNSHATIAVNMVLKPCSGVDFGMGKPNNSRNGLAPDVAISMPPAITLATTNQKNATHRILNTMY